MASNGNDLYLGGISVVVSDALPIPPSDGARARRMVRHGMADVLAWLGEDVGPKPDDETQILFVGSTIHASAAVAGRLREVAMPLGATS